MPAPYTPARMVPIGKVPPAPPPSELGPDTIDRGMRAFAIRDAYAQGSVANSALGRQTVCSWSSPFPRLVAVYVAADWRGTTIGSATAPLWFISFSVGSQAAFPPIVFQHGSGPIVLYASQVTVQAEGIFSTPGAFFYTAAIGPGEGITVSRGPILINPYPPTGGLGTVSTSNIRINIAAAGALSFALSPYTRRVRVARITGTTTFTVSDSISSYTVGSGVEMPYVEIASYDRLITVTNTSAGADNFTIYEELDL